MYLHVIADRVLISEEYSECQFHSIEGGGLPHELNGVPQMVRITWETLCVLEFQADLFILVDFDDESL
jgi:hypothetical protein